MTIYSLSWTWTQIWSEMGYQSNLEGNWQLNFSVKHENHSTGYSQIVKLKRERKGGKNKKKAKKIDEKVQERQQ